MADGGTDPDELEAFVKRVRDLSNGTLRIKLRDSWRAGQTTWETGVIRDVQAGKADLGWAAPRAWDTVGIESFRALNTPLLIDTYALEEKVLASPIVKPMLAALKPLGLVGLGILPGQMRRPFGLRHPLLRPSDFAGKTLGVQESRVADETLNALGARSVRLPITRVNVARYDGLEQRISTIAAWYSGHGGYVSANVNLWPRPLVLFANARVFASLTAIQRRALYQAAPGLIHAQTSHVVALDRESGGNICRAASVTLQTAAAGDLAQLRAAVQPVYSDLQRDPATRRAITDIEQLKRGSPPAPPDAIGGCRGRAAAGRKKTPVDGTWAMTTARRDAGPDYAAENWGKWIFVFDRGRFADTQENKQACTWGYGTYTLKGDKVEWTFKDGGGEAPNGAQNKPGEYFVYGWSRYHDTLTLTPVKGQISPGNFKVHPWRLISPRPSPNRMSKRCPPPRVALSP
jgi:TRAP-type C4-dicarboxylate transport system substrate-binding protein